MKEKISRWCEDTFYTLLSRFRPVLEWLHILHAPTEQEVQRGNEKLLADLDLL